MTKLICCLGSGCWEYQGSRNNGYGVFVIGKVRSPAHVAAYRLLVGPVGEGLELDHLCRNRSCCRPEHLEAVTHQTNIVRMYGDTCRFGQHPLTPDNTYVRKNGQRLCKCCARAYQQRYYEAHGRADRPAAKLGSRGRRVYDYRDKEV